MALLLDTQIIIWIEQDRDRIPEPIKREIALSKANYFSAVSVWELAIKIKTGKLVLKHPLPLFIENFIEGYKVMYLPISLSHIYKTFELPLHHNDPFDRLIMAQALAENMPVISSDAKFDAYPVTRIW